MAIQVPAVLADVQPGDRRVQITESIMSALPGTSVERYTSGALRQQHSSATHKNTAVQTNVELT